jgi:hypothetical protein
MHPLIIRRAPLKYSSSTLGGRRGLWESSRAVGRCAGSWRRREAITAMGQHKGNDVKGIRLTLLLARTLSIPIAREVHLGLPEVFKHGYALRSGRKGIVHLEENDLRNMGPRSDAILKPTHPQAVHIGFAVIAGSSFPGLHFRSYVQLSSNLC